MEAGATGPPGPNVPPRALKTPARFENVIASVTTRQFVTEENSAMVSEKKMNNVPVATTTRYRHFIKEPQCSRKSAQNEQLNIFSFSHHFQQSIYLLNIFLVDEY